MAWIGNWVILFLMKRVFPKILRYLSVGCLSTAMSAFLFAPTAFGITMEVADNVLITQNLLDDAYVLAGNSNIEADIFGDLYIGGGSIVINGDVHEDLVVSAGKVTVTGDVFGDLRVLGGQVAIYGNVGDDLVIGGGQVDIGKSSVVAGTLVVGAGVLTIDGQIREEVRGGVGMFFLNGTVDKNVILTVEDTMNISDQASIGGDLKYSSLIETPVPEGVVAGEIKFNKFERESVLEDVTYVFFVQKLLSYFAALILMFIMVMGMPNWLLNAAAETKKNVFKAFGVGLLSIITAVVGSIILMITILGIPIAMIAFALLLILVYISKIVVSAWTVSYFMNFKKKVNRFKLFGAMALALLVYYLVGMIPFVGWVINGALFLIGVGTIVLMKIDYFRFMKSKKMV